MKLDRGYAQFPVGSYYYPEFTYMIWVKALSYNDYQRIIDFGNGYLIDNFLICFHAETAAVQLNFNEEYKYDKNSIFPIDQWVHVAVTSNTVTTLYINGEEMFRYQTSIKSVETKFNYIGKKNVDSTVYLHAVLDEFKIFNRALSKEEIKIEKDIVQPYKIIKA